MIRAATLFAVGLCVLLTALLVDRQLDRAVEAEPAWLVVRVENKLEVEVQLLQMAVHDGTLQGAEPAWPLLLAPSASSGHVWTTGRHHLDRKRTTVELQLWRPDAAGPESHALPIEAREGGVCHLVVEVLPEGVRSDACSYWTPTYRGWPH